MKINEIFLSIQGESTYAGRPCLFIRTTGCNLRCTYCDTEYAFYDGKDMSIDELYSVVRNSGVRLVEITGGEPLIQKDINELVKVLLKDEYEVLVETSGSLDIDIIDRRAVRIMDMKCPSSGMESKNDYANIEKLTHQDEIKFVIENKEDYDWSMSIVEKYDLNNKLSILMSPVFDKIEPETLANWILHDKKNVRMQLQMHKYIWGSEVTGV